MKKEQFLHELGENIRRIREEKKISKLKLGRDTDKDYHSLTRMEKGRINCTLYYLCEIADGLGVGVDELVKGL